MACYYCRNFSEDEEHEKQLREMTPKLSIIESVRQAKGACTLSPTWETVTGLHYCSQLAPKAAEDLGLFWTQMHQASERADIERKRRIEAEQKLKELRTRTRAKT